MKELLSFLVGAFNKRYTSKEKNNFIIYLNNYFKQNKQTLRLVKTKSSFASANNLFVGDTKKCSYLISSSYDTLDKVFTKAYKYNPANLDSHNSYQRMTIVIKIAMLITTVFIAYIALKDSKIYTSGQRIIATVVAILMFAITTIYGKGIANKQNASNSSAIAVAITSFLDTNKKASLILCDYSNASLNGLKSFMKENASLAKLPLIYLDSITPSGDIRIYAYKENIKMAKELCQLIEGAKTIELLGNSCISDFKENAIMIATTSEYKNGYYVKNVRTNKDIDIDIDRLETIKKGIVDYINQK